MKYLFHKLEDILITNLRHSLPAIFKWFYRLKIKQNLFPFQLNESSGQIATLYSHGRWVPEQKETQAILLLHGQDSHPFTLLHLTDIAQQTKIGPVFSLYLTYHLSDPAVHRSLLKKAIDHIEKKVLEKGCSLQGILIAGHSMGAIEACYQAFVEEDKRLISVISIAGRLKVVDSLYNPCNLTLRPTVEKVYEGIQSLTAFPLYQIVGREDWNAPLEAMIPRIDKTCYHIIEDAMHFNILFHPETQKIFSHFLNRPLA